MTIVTIEFLLVALVALLIILRQLLLAGVRAARVGAALVLCWATIAAGVAAAGPNTIPQLVTITLVGVGSTWLLYDWKRLGRASLDLAHYQGVVSQLERQHDDREASGGAGHVAAVGGDHPDDIA